MALTQYLCYSLETGVTMIGFFNLWAALFFLARFTEFNNPTMWPDLIISACYIIRVVYFFIMVDQETDQSKKNYFTANKWTTFGLVAGAILLITFFWTEFNRVPYSSIGCWVAIGGIEAYHWFVIKDYAGITVGSFDNYLAKNMIPIKSLQSQRVSKTEAETPMVFIVNQLV